jgi:hypothetical protein
MAELAELTKRLLRHAGITQVRIRKPCDHQRIVLGRRGLGRTQPHGLRYLAELLARIYGVTLPSDVSDLEREYHAREPEQAERTRRELARRGI